VISTVVGLRSVSQEMIDLGRSMGLGVSQMFLKIRLPCALPSIFGGFKVAITLSVVGAVVGEFVGADRGLGYVILLASGQLNMDIMFAAIVLLVIVGVALFALVQWTERILLPWHPSVRSLEGGM
jgi:NitT/TauT family transport system permease protein